MHVEEEKWSLEIENSLLEQLDFEGMLINLLDPQLGMLVMSSKDDTFTLHIYKLQSQNKEKYHIVEKITTKTFTTLMGMQYFLNIFSNYTSEEFMGFINEFNP